MSTTSKLPPTVLKVLEEQYASPFPFSSRVNSAMQDAGLLTLDEWHKWHDILDATEKSEEMSGWLWPMNFDLISFYLAEAGEL